MTSEITNDFLRARSLLLLFDHQLACGPVFARNATKLAKLADDQLAAFRDDRRLYQQLRSDHAVAFAKWGLIPEGTNTIPIAPDSPVSIESVQRIAKLANATTSAKAALDVLEALEGDLPAHCKARISISRAVAATLQDKAALATQSVTDALKFASKESDQAEQGIVFREIGKSAVQTNCHDIAKEWAKGQADAMIRAAVFVGIAEGLIDEESLTRAAAEGLRITGEIGPMSRPRVSDNMLWKEFIAAIPAALNPNGGTEFVRLNDGLQILIVPTNDGIRLVMPPNLAGLKAWVAVVAKSIFAKDELAALANFVEKPVGYTETKGRFRLKKQIAAVPRDWIVVTLAPVTMKSRGSSNNPLRTRNASGEGEADTR